MKVKSTKQLLAENDQLIHATMQTVYSHVQRRDGDWIVNTIMLEGQDVPYKYKRRKKHPSLKGARVELIYYPDVEIIARMQFDCMRVIRIQRC